MFKYLDNQLWHLKGKRTYAFLISASCLIVLISSYFVILLYTHHPKEENIRFQAKIVRVEAENLLQEIHNQLNATIPLMTEKCSEVKNKISEAAALSVDIRSITLLSDSKFSYCSSIFGEYRTNLTNHNKSNLQDSAYFVPKTRISNKPVVFYYHRLNDGKGILIVASTDHLKQALLHTSTRFTNHSVLINGEKLTKNGQLLPKDPLAKKHFILQSSKYPELSILSEVKPNLTQLIIRENLESLYWVSGLSFALSFSLYQLIKQTRFTKLVLSAAIKNKEFEFFLQPIMDVKNNRCTGMEALIRWRHPALGILSPAYFLDELIRTKLLAKVSIQLIHVAMDRMHLRFQQPCYLSINIEPEMLENNDLIDTIQSYLNKPESKDYPFVLELTERSFHNFTDAQKNYLDKLSKLGAHFAIDDFGTGKSNLSHLTQIKFDYLKIDASFVAAIGSNNTTSNMLDSIIELGHKFDLTIIAEGIETDEQRDYLISKGVYLQQGFLFAHAMSPEDAGHFVESIAKKQQQP